MVLRQVGSKVAAVLRRATTIARELRPGAVLGLSVAVVAGLAGLAEWNPQLVVIGVVAGVAILAVNAVLLAARSWHVRNTAPEASYMDAEDVVRMRSPKTR